MIKERIKERIRKRKMAITVLWRLLYSETMTKGDKRDQRREERKNYHNTVL